MLRKAGIFYLMLCMVCLSSGCASLLITGASGGVAYTYTNIAYKTVCYPVDKVVSAMNRALKKMGIREVEHTKENNEIAIKAATTSLTIYIDLEKITAKSTKIVVDARKKVVLKDKATAMEIIEQTIRILEGRS
ncbi:MAG: DUF3568 family protein [Nitrospirota bacterium]